MFKYILLTLIVLALINVIAYTRRHGVSMLIQVIFRPIVRWTVSSRFQMTFSAWVTALWNAHIDFMRTPQGATRSNWLDGVFHRLYWVFNPRGESNSKSLVRSYHVKGALVCLILGKVYMSNGYKHFRQGSIDIYRLTISILGYGFFVSVTTKQNYYANDEY